MINKLIEKIKIRKEYTEIKKHFKVAKKHRSASELETVKLELLDFQGKLIEEEKYSDNINFEIFNLFAKIDYFKLNYIPTADVEL